MILQIMISIVKNLQFIRFFCLKMLVIVLKKPKTRNLETSNKFFKLGLSVCSLSQVFPVSVAYKQSPLKASAWINGYI